MQYWEEDWMYEAPKAGESKSKQAKNRGGKLKQYHYCPKHKKWTVHKPEKCTYSPKNKENGSSEPAAKKPKFSDQKARLKLSKALLATIQQANADDSSDDEEK